jgi:formylglycine-generating enzyme required for sulfatase activity
VALLLCLIGLLAPLPAAAQRDPVRFRDCAECPEMVVLPAGSFTMGSAPGEQGRVDDRESPTRQVTIARRFAVGRFEVTFAEWDACVAAGGCKHRPDDRGWGRDKQPVINVSWDDVTMEYLPWLSRRTGKAYRLLTEAEWEYAARGVTSASAPGRRYWWGDQASREHANYGKDQCCAAPVGQLLPNPFGLHDMHGNVWEWVQDCWHGSYAGAPVDGSAWTSSCSEPTRVLRGGSWHDSPEQIRSAHRARIRPAVRIFGYGTGFRVARTLDDR